MDGSEVGSGMVSGAWGYVIVVYATTWAVVIGLAVRAILASRGRSVSTGGDAVAPPHEGGAA